MSERAAFAVDQNFHQESVFFKAGETAQEVLVRSTIHTSEFLVLTAPTADLGTGRGVCPIAETADYTIHGDVVRIAGPIRAPGRSIKIVCRRLELDADAQMRPAAIVVDGVDGEPGDVVRAVPAKGADGSSFGDHGGAGEEGKPGSDGKSAGAAGGTIEIHCGGLKLRTDAVLSANGGCGGAGSKGTSGGTGGRGHEGFNRTMDDMRHLKETAGKGGRGGYGGPGGAGNHGGRGGSIILDYGGTLAEGGKLTLSVKGGEGGAGGEGGEGGKGGDTARGHRFDFKLLAGGDGGPGGEGGKGGQGGKGGCLSIANEAAGTAGFDLHVAHGGRGADGPNGKAGAAGAREPDRHVMATARDEIWGPAVGQGPPAPRSLPATAHADTMTDGSVQTAAFSYSSLCRQVSFGQLRMLMERLRYSFLRLGRANLDLDPKQQSAEYFDLLAGLLWIKDLFTTQERQFDTVLRDSLDDALYVFKGTHFRKYDGRTRRLVEEGSDPRGSDWPGLWKDGRLDAAILAYYKQDARPGEQPKFGGRAIFFRPGEIMFHARRELPANKRAWAKALGDRCPELRDGIDAAVNVTADGSCGFLFKGTNYFKYTLERYTWGLGEQFSAIEGPFPVAQDFPGLWTTDVALAYAGKPDCILVFQRTGRFDHGMTFRSPEYMVYNLASKMVEAGYPRSIAEDWPGLIQPETAMSGLDLGSAGVLLAKADTLLGNLRLEADYFGNPSEYTVLELHDYFETAKTKALSHLTSAEREYKAYQTAMNAAAERTAGLTLAVNFEGSRLKTLQTATSDTLTQANDAFAQIDRLRGLMEAKANALANDTKDLQADLRRDWGVTWQDLFGCLTQLSFMHWLNESKEPDTGPGLMAMSQVGDLLNKGINNVVTDSGESMNRHYVVRRVDSLAKEVRSFKDLTVTRSRLIDPTNLYNDAYKLALTRDQFKEMCGEFTTKFPAAKKIIDDLDEYVSLADQRNAAVLEYNRLWQSVGDLQAEAARCKLDVEQAQAAIAGRLQPQLSVFTSLATERYNRAKDQTLHIFYLASRASVMRSLQARNFFGEMLRTLPDGGQIDAATFTQSSLQDLYDEVLDDLKLSSPTGPGTAALVFTKDTHPEMFAALAKEGVATLAVRKATSKTTRGPFAYMANVRLSRVRCWVGGLSAGEKHHLRLVHSGRETFVSAAGKELTVEHDSCTLAYAYTASTEIDPTAKDFQFHGTEEAKPLAGTKFGLLGPFTTWYLLIDDAEDRVKATSLRVEFDVVYDGFEAHPGS
ncbi:MAG: hypothetical protein U1E45_11740 [Geminicoccaceae bacterium]